MLTVRGSTEGATIKLELKLNIKAGIFLGVPRLLIGRSGVLSTLKVTL